MLHATAPYRKPPTPKPEPTPLVTAQPTLRARKRAFAQRPNAQHRLTQAHFPCACPSAQPTSRARRRASAQASQGPRQQPASIIFTSWGSAAPPAQPPPRAAPPRTLAGRAPASPATPALTGGAPGRSEHEHRTQTVVSAPSVRSLCALHDLLTALKAPSVGGRVATPDVTQDAPCLL